MKIPMSFITTLLILVLSVLSIIIPHFSYASLDISGYYPVSAKDEFCSRPSPIELPDNPLYKKWCEERFIHGSYIYEAYRQIAFGIEYTPEPPKVDLWQTPFETMKIHGGDCEDAILLFCELLPKSYNYGEIIWGVIFDVKSLIHFAHVWFKLYDKNGEVYVVEPFSGRWNGIIPMEIIKEREIRQDIITIPNTMISDLLTSDSPQYQDIQRFIDNQLVTYDWRQKKEADNIFTKLAQLTRRYKRQQKK